VAADDARLDELVAAVLAGANYRGLAPEVVRGVAARELAKGRRGREALKATRGALHQVAGAYFDRRPDYAAWLDDLRAAVGDRAALRRACARIMAHHASTRERLPLLDEFYATTLAAIPPPRRVLDVACGLGPLAIPWLPPAEGATYLAYDIYADLAGFLDAALPLLGVAGRAEARDVLQRPPAERADLALVLKAIPCLEQLDPAAGARLLAGLDADHVLVSFPVRSLGGRRKGMVANYEARFGALVAGRGWTVRRFQFATELAFLVSK
jgi:16S rRNA (guanine(1405)-N(7))-methyltransferase